MVWTSDFIDSAFLAKTTFPDDVYLKKLFGVTETDEHIRALKHTQQNNLCVGFETLQMTSLSVGSQLLHVDINMLGLQLHLTFCFYFPQKEYRSEPICCKTKSQTKINESVNNFSACSLEYLLQAEVLQEKGKEVCPHQQGVGGQTTSWQQLALREALMEF